MSALGVHESPKSGSGTRWWRQIFDRKLWTCELGYGADTMFMYFLFQCIFPPSLARCNLQLTYLLTYLLTYFPCCLGFVSFCMCIIYLHVLLCYLVLWPQDWINKYYKLTASVYPAKAGREVGALNWTQEPKNVWDGPTSKATGHAPRPAHDWPVPKSASVQACARTGTAGHCAV